MPTIAEEREIANSYDWETIAQFVRKLPNTDLSANDAVEEVNKAGFRTRTGRLWTYSSFSGELRSAGIKIRWKRKNRVRPGLSDEDIENWHERWCDARRKGYATNLNSICSYWNNLGYLTPHEKIWKKANLSLWRLRWIKQSNFLFDWPADQEKITKLKTALLRYALDTLSDEDMEKCIDEAGVPMETGREIIENLKVQHEDV